MWSAAWLIVAFDLHELRPMTDTRFTSLECALAACLLCAKGMASRDPRAAQELRVVIAMLQSAHDELVTQGDRAVA